MFEKGTDLTVLNKYDSHNLRPRQLAVHRCREWIWRSEINEVLFEWFTTFSPRMLDISVCIVEVVVAIVSGKTFVGRINLGLPSDVKVQYINETPDRVCLCTKLLRF